MLVDAALPAEDAVTEAADAANDVASAPDTEALAAADATIDDGGADTRSFDAASDATAGDSGTLSDGGLVLSASALQFGGFCGETPSPQTVNLTNMGSASVSWTGSVPGSRYSLAPAGSTLNSGESATLTITPSEIPMYPSSQSGTCKGGYLVWTDTLTISADLAAQPTLSVSLQEQADGTFLTSVPTNIDFGNVAVGSTSTQTWNSPTWTCGPGGFPAIMGGVSGEFTAQLNTITTTFQVTFSPTMTGFADMAFTWIFPPNGNLCSPNKTIVTGTGI